MNINEKINLIKEQLEKLRSLDKTCELFGASRHEYQPNEKLTEDEIQSFENRFSIHLPEEYRAWLLQIGNGGVGPYYGLERLEDSLFADLDRRTKGGFVNPSIPFPLEDAWNMEFDGDENSEAEYEAFENEYFSEKWDSGLLRICNFGCGVSMNLIVNGKEKGNIWVDDRCNDQGIYPDVYFGQTGRTSFLDWYLMWLESSLKDLGNN